VIGWYVHHVGRGHLTRATAVAARLRHRVTGLGSLPPPTGWPGRWVELERDDVHPPYAARADVTARGTLHWAPVHDPGLATRQARVARWLARERPSLLVVDVSVEVALLARLCGVPVAVVALPGDRLDRAHRTAYDLAEVLVAPWPEGTHSAGWPEAWLAKTCHVGAVSRFDGAPRPVGVLGPRPRVLLLWGAGGRTTTDADVRTARAATPDWDWVVRTPEAPSADLWRELADADVVVTHAGQNAVAEVAAARRPAVVVAQPRPFGEQVATARAVQRLGVAVGLESWPAEQDWPATLEKALAVGGDAWAAWSSGDGAYRAARRLDALADGLRPASARGLGRP
jgi:hypothetical protein